LVTVHEKFGKINATYGGNYLVGRAFIKTKLNLVNFNLKKIAVGELPASITL